MWNNSNRKVKKKRRLGVFMGWWSFVMEQKSRPVRRLKEREIEREGTDRIDAR
jgi:hypothetical protein